MTWKRGIWLALVLAVAVIGGQTVKAQSSPAVMSHGATIAFPAAIRFEVVVDTQEGVSAAILTLKQGERTLFEGVVAPEPSPTDDAMATFVLDWPIPVDDPPALFVDIQYMWDITVSGGGALEAGDTISFQPGAQTWRSGGEPPLSFAVGDSPLNLTVARQAVMPAYDLLARQTGMAPEFKWVVLSRGERFCVDSTDEEGAAISVVSLATDETVVFPCSEATAEEILASSGWRVLYRTTSGLLPFQDEVVDALFADFWGGRNLPPWFQSGLRQYYHVNPDPLVIRQVQEAARRAGLYTASALERGPDPADQYDLWSRQTRALVLFIADQCGADAPLELARLAEEEAFDAALQAVTGMNLQQLLIAFERWIYTESAIRAGAWTPYSPQTPTPQPTRTATLPAPTATPTATSTRTAVPSATSTIGVAGVITALPGPGEEASTPPAATNTPRPPGSLDLDQNEGAATPGGLCPAALPALLMPVLGLAVIHPRRKSR